MKEEIKRTQNNIRSNIAIAAFILSLIPFIFTLLTFFILLGPDLGESKGAVLFILVYFYRTIGVLLVIISIILAIIAQ